MRLTLTRLLTLLSALFLLSALTTAAPTTLASLTSPNLPAPDLKAMLSARYTCPGYAPHCGYTTSTNGVDTWFGKGDCIPLGDNTKSIYVARCYCVLWESCTGDLHQDGPKIVDAMKLCEGPWALSTFPKMPRFVSCDGQPQGGVFLR